MSVRLLSTVFRESQAEMAHRLVLLALADSAHDDGITWLDQPTIAAKARVDERTVRRAITQLERMGELEVRKAQRGRRRINVYRLTCAVDEPDYDRLPFQLTDEFATTGHPVPDDRTSATATTGHPDRSSDRSSSETRASMGVDVKGTVRGPVSEQPPTVSARKRDPVFDAMADATHSDPHLEGARIGVAISKLRKHPDYLDAVERLGKDAADAALALEIPLRAEAYVQYFGEEVALTPTALVAHWRRVAAQPLTPLQAAEERLRQERGER